MKELSLLIINWLKIYYLIETTSLTPLPLGADPNAYTFKVRAENQKTYFVKVKKGSIHPIHHDILHFLKESKVDKLILPIETTTGLLIQDVEGFSLLVYPFIPGVNGFSQPLSDNQWIELGQAMRQIHQAHLPQSLLQSIRKEQFSPKWREFVRSLYSKPINTDDCDDIALSFYQFLQENKSIILQLVSCSHKLSEQVQSTASQFVFCHSDIHGGNIIIDDDRLYIVDWDDPILAPKERDLMFFGGGVGNVWNQSKEEKLFYQGYGQTRIDWSLMSYYRFERIVEDIAEYANELLLEPKKNTHRLEMLGHFMSIFKPGGVVQIAFATYKRTT